MWQFLKQNNECDYLLKIQSQLTTSGHHISYMEKIVSVCLNMYVPDYHSLEIPPQNLHWSQGDVYTAEKTTSYWLFDIAFHSKFVIDNGYGTTILWGSFTSTIVNSVIKSDSFMFFFPFCYFLFSRYKKSYIPENYTYRKSFMNE